MPKDKTVLDQIDVSILIELRKYPPSTMRAIGAVINRSHVVVRQRMRWLERKGYIKQAEGAPRSKILTKQGFDFLDGRPNSSRS